MLIKIKFYSTIFLLLFLAKNEVIAQPSQEFDSLRIKIEALNKTLPDSALQLLPQLQKLVSKFSSQEVQAKLWQTTASIKASHTLYDEAKLFNDSSYAINKKNNYKIELLKNLSLYGKIYQHKSDDVNAIKYFLQTVELAKETKVYPTLKYAYRALSKISYNQSNEKEALEYAIQSLSYEKVSPNAREEGLGYMEIANYYSTKNIDSAEKYYGKAYTIFEKNKIDYSKAWSLALWSTIYAEKDVIKTGEMMLKAQAIFDTIAPKDVFSASNIGNIGEIFFTIAQSDSLLAKIRGKAFPQTKQLLLQASEKYMERCVTYSAESKTLRQELYYKGNLANLYAYTGDYKKAYTALQAKIVLNDSVYSQKNKNAIAKLIAEKDVLKLTAENNQKSIINKFLIASAAALLFIGFLGYRSFKNKQKVSSQQQLLQQAKITELEKDKQLQTIDAMLKGQEDERSRIAKDLHDGLGGMLSGTKLSFMHMKENLVLTPENTSLFDKSLSMLDNTIADLRKVAHNLMPEALVKFGLDEALKDFCNSVQSSSTLKVLHQQVGEKRKLSNTAEVFTYRIIQELVNNAIKHADAKQIIVQLNYTSTALHITVEDDGKGFDINSIANSKGAGMDNIKYRVQYFNGTLDIVTAPGKGTSINIELNT